jgi:AcrR family transcriptional regulator
LTRDQIVAAAVAVVDRDGLVNLSMRKLAAELGVGVTTLYWHVADKDEVLDLICDRVLGEIDLVAPADASWTERLISLFSELRAALLRHADLATLLPTRENVGPNALAVREAVAVALLDAGLPQALLAATDHALLSYVTGSAAGEVGRRAVSEQQGADVESADAEETAFLAALPGDTFPGLVTLARTRPAEDRDSAFEYGLRVMLAGVAAHVQAPVRRAPRRTGLRAR